MIKFLHAADIHLDSPLHKLDHYEGAPVDELRQATRRAFENLMELALAESGQDGHDYGETSFFNSWTLLSRNLPLAAGAGPPESLSYASWFFNVSKSFAFQRAGSDRRGSSLRIWLNV